MLEINLKIDFDEDIIERLNAICKLKNVALEELIRNFVARQLVAEEESQISKIKEEMPIELILENFDI